MLEFPKPSRERNAEYLAWVRVQPCAIGFHCHGAVQPHHLQTRGSGGSDYTSLPLCVQHHVEIHTIGVARFEQTYSVNVWRLALHTLVRWFTAEPRSTSPDM